MSTCATKIILEIDGNSDLKLNFLENYGWNGALK